MSQYDTTLDPSVSNNSHAQLLDMVGGNKTVLDVGCATGYLGAELVDRGCTVDGVESDVEAAAKAAAVLRRVVVGDLAVLDLEHELEGQRYDRIVCGDVLEHLAEPAPVLRRLVGLLAPGGSVVISIPNVSHGSIRLALLQGRWEYQDLGLLDRTHIRFFTRRTLLELLHGAGLAAAEVRTTVKDPLASEVQVDPQDLPPGAVDWVRAQPDAMTYQFLVRAVPDDSVAAVDAVRARAEGLAEELAVARARATELEAELARARNDLSVLRTTRAMRALELPRRLYGRARRAVGGLR
jgi:2-polyprenyl-3-methyl-5-hydroxy-6-metoxy-1,4-benzoquinol methylase